MPFALFFTILPRNFYSVILLYVYTHSLTWNFNDEHSSGARPKEIPNIVVKNRNGAETVMTAESIYDNYI